MNHFNLPYLIVLGCLFAWITFFSLFTRPIRGFRNLGILGAYISFIVAVCMVPFTQVLLDWLAFGLLGGVLYVIHDLFFWMRKKKDEQQRVSLGHLIVGPLAWPIMGPEAIENLLAETGILKSGTASAADRQDDAKEPEKAADG